MTRSNVILVLLSFVTLFFAAQALQYASGSPGFGREVISVPTNHWYDMYRHKATTNGSSYVDLREVTYFSDGRTLNATLWLDSFEQMPPPDWNVNYGMYIDSDLDNDTGIQGIDFKVEIMWSNNTWTRVFEEWSSNGKIKDVEKPLNNFTSFYAKGHSYVTISANLDRLISPDRYRVTFYAEELKYPVWNMDASDWVYVPPPKITLSPSPSLVDIRAGDDRTIEIRLNSTKGFDPTISLSVQGQSGDLRGTFSDAHLRIPSYSVASTSLLIRASEFAPIRTFTLVIFGNFTIPVEFVKSNNSTTILPPTVGNHMMVTDTLLNVNVEHPLTFQDQMANFSAISTPLLAFVSAVISIATGLGGFFYGKSKGKKSRSTG